jgi:hypothetical protein
MSQQNRLSLEQEFSLKMVASQVQALTHQEAQELIVELQRQLMVKDNLYKQLIKQDWGI